MFLLVLIYFLIRYSIIDFFLPHFSNFLKILDSLLVASSPASLSRPAAIQSSLLLLQKGGGRSRRGKLKASRSLFSEDQDDDGSQDKSQSQSQSSQEEDLSHGQGGSFNPSFSPVSRPLPDASCTSPSMLLLPKAKGLDEDDDVDSEARATAGLGAPEMTGGASKFNFKSRSRKPPAPSLPKPLVFVLGEPSSSSSSSYSISSSSGALTHNSTTPIPVPVSTPLSSTPSTSSSSFSLSTPGSNGGYNNRKSRLSDLSHALFVLEDAVSRSADNAVSTIQHKIFLENRQKRNFLFDEE